MCSLTFLKSWGMSVTIPKLSGFINYKLMWISKHKLTKKSGCWVKLEKYQMINQIEKIFLPVRQVLFQSLKSDGQKTCWNLILTSAPCCPGRVFHMHALLTHSPNPPDLKCTRYPDLWGCTVVISAVGALRGFWFTLGSLRWNCWEVLKRNTFFPYARKNTKPHYVHYPCSASILQDCKIVLIKACCAKAIFKLLFFRKFNQ